MPSLRLESTHALLVSSLVLRWICLVLDPSLPSVRPRMRTATVRARVWGP